MTNQNDNASRGLMTIGYHTSAPRTSVRDDRGTNAVAEKFEAVAAEIGNFTRRVIPAEFLRPRTRIINEFAKFHREVTVPYGRAKKGVGIVKPETAIEYKKKFRVVKREHDAAVDRIMDQYDAIVKHQKEMSGSMFIPSADDPNRGVEIPPREEFREAFVFEIIEPARLENPEDLLGFLDKDEIEEVKQQVDAEIRESVTASIRPCFEAVQKMAQSLRNYDPDNGKKGAFRKTLVTNVQHLAELLDTVNFTDNEQITHIKQEILDNLVQFDEKQLKDSEPLRNAIADKADEILEDNFAAFDL